MDCAFWGTPRPPTRRGAHWTARQALAPASYAAARHGPPAAMQNDDFKRMVMSGAATPRRPAEGGASKGGGAGATGSARRGGSSAPAFAPRSARPRPKGTYVRPVPRVRARIWLGVVCVCWRPMDGIIMRVHCTRHGRAVFGCLCLYHTVSSILMRVPQPDHPLTDTRWVASRHTEAEGR